MADRGIIFSTSMVRALLDGRKTQTRRLIRGAPNDACWHCDGRGGRLWFVADGGSPSLPVRLPFVVGDRLWVREAWKPHSTFDGIPPRDIPPSTVFYAADDTYAPSGTPWRSPIHMPRWASRLTLTVTDVRVQRLQGLSEEDAVAEGVQEDVVGWRVAGHPCGTTPRAAYALVWNSLHGPAAWDRNPWVAAITFRLAASATRAPAPGDGTSGVSR